MKKKPTYEELEKRISELERENYDWRRAEEAHKASEAQKQGILDASVDRIRLVHPDMSIIWANKTTTRELRLNPESVVGKKCHEVLVGRKTPCAQCPSTKALKTGRIEHSVIHRSPEKGAKREAYWDNYAVPIKDRSGRIVNLIQITRNITQQKKAEKALKDRQKELSIQRRSLQELNSALRVLLEKRDNDKRELEEKLLANVKELVIPYVEKLKGTKLEFKQLAYLEILESNLNDIVSPFSRTLSSKYLSLTPTEIQVANMVKVGKTSQEIAELMGLSRRTVESHRDNIRKKLGLSNRKAQIPPAIGLRIRICS